ncbi:MAG: tetraacyldisaccharide 4'-kinase [Bdellovibrionota bacterium]
MIFLKPVEKLFHLLVHTKNRLYSLQILNAVKLSIPVISVGNLSFGGVGKTPCVIFLAEELVKKYKINIITKSYKANLRYPERVKLKSDNSAQKFGDESCLLQAQLPSCNVWAGPNKSQTALASLVDQPGLIILDDGFSHLKLKRNFDLLLIDATQGFNTYLREPIGSLKRAHAVLITKTNLSQSEKVSEIKKQIANLAPHLSEHIFLSRMKTELALDKIMPLFIFCGLGRPETFVQDLTQQGYKVVHQKFFPDHHNYTISDQQQLLDEYNKLLKKHDNIRLVTTEKDLTKISEISLKKYLTVPKHNLEMDRVQKEALFEKIRLSL